MTRHDDGRVIYDTNEEAQEACEFWQALLFVSDWTVETKIISHHQMSNRLRAGEIDILSAKKRAVISLLHPDGYAMLPSMEGGPVIEPQDHEKTLVHELQHLVHDWL